MCLAAVYFVAGKLGLQLAFVHASASPVWAPTGIALAALLLFDYGVWPAIFIAAFLVNVTTYGSVVTSLGIAAGNTLEGLVGAYLVRRYAGGLRTWERAADVFRTAGLAAVLSTTISATVGLITLTLAGYAQWASFGPIWLTWWLGDAVGDVLIASLILTWWTTPLGFRRWTRTQLMELASLSACVVIVGFAVFGGSLPTAERHFPLEFLCIPVFVWAGFRFGPREAATAVVLTAAIAIRGTLLGVGPFAQGRPNDSLLLLQAFLGVTGLMTLALAAVVLERRRVEERLRHLAQSDPLTGLGNYRRLIAVLEAEVKRSNRTERPFAVLMLDLDGLKRINDRHGHLVGSRALTRLAEALHASCRAIDTACRFGGDEFALVLPETTEEPARRVAARIGERLASDGEQPPVEVSIGVAIYPHDGDTVEAMLGASDRALYAEKRRKQVSTSSRAR